MSVIQKGKSLRIEGLIRIFVLAVVWCAIYIPRAPRWTIADQVIFHVACGFWLIWAGMVLVNFLIRKTPSPVLAKAVLVSDAVGLSLLIHFTGGTASPFLILLLLAIMAMVILRGASNAMTLGFSSAFLLAGSISLTRTEAIPTISAYSLGAGLPVFDNLLFLGTAIGLGVLFLLTCFLLVTLGYGRMRRMQVELEDLRSQLNFANDELTNSFHKLEGISAALNRQAERLLVREGDRNQDQHVKH